MSSIKVSVVIPVYNVEKYLNECMDSVINQTLKEIEIICVDDGSTDSSLSILHEYAKQDSRITILTQENQGAGVARNTGLDIATGEYLSFLDADDFFHLEMLEKAYNQSSYLKAEICVFKSNSYNTSKKIYKELNYTIKCDFSNNQLFKPKDIESNIFKCFVGWAWDKLFLTKFIKNNNLNFQNLRSTNDMFFVFASIVTANKITILNEVLAYHRVELNTSISNTRELSWDCFYKALITVKQYLIKIDLYDYYRVDFINYSLHSTLWNLNTLQGETVELLYDKLREEWFKELEIDNLKEFDIDNKNEYNEYINVTLKPFKNSKYAIPDNNPIKVSVIMPSLNVISYIKECIESVINQTLKEIEIICVDAGSTDGTLEILNHYASQDSRIKIIISDKKSYGYQMNLGIANAKGDYIGIVETDDYILPNMYETLYNIAKTEKVQVVKSDFFRFVNNGSQIQEFKTITNEDNYYHTKLNPSKNPNLILTNTLNQIGIFSLNFIKYNNIKFNETPGASFQDNGFHFQVFCLADTLYFVKSAFYMLRRDNPNSSILSFGNYDKLYCMSDEYDFILEFLNRNPNLKEKFKKVFIQKCYGNYLFVLWRIEPSFRKEFICNFSLKFTQYKNMNLYQMDDFKEPQRKKLQQILDDPVRYSNQINNINSDDVCNVKTNQIKPNNYNKSSINNAKTNQINGQLRWARSELDKVRSERLELKKELAQIKGISSSVSYKIGRFITWLPRKLKKKLNKQETNVYTITNNKDYNYYKKLPTEFYEAELCEWYEKRTGKTLDLLNPKTFNEKIQWLKLYDSTPLKTKLADKYLVRNWIKKKIGEEYLIPLLGVWDSFDEIDFDKLPKQFALKTNHGSGWNYIVKDKSTFEKKDAKKKFDIWISKNYSFVFGFELHYSNIKPKIIAEQYIQNTEKLYDYKFFCYSGIVDFVWVDIGSGTNLHMRNIYDLNWKLQDVSVSYPNIPHEIEKPQNFHKMIEFSKKLSKNFAFVRIDFYEIEDKLYFGEMTFTSQSGVADLSDELNKSYGDKIKLPKKKKIYKLKI